MSWPPGALGISPCLSILNDVQSDIVKWKGYMKGKWRSDVLSFWNLKTIDFAQQVSHKKKRAWFSGPHCPKYLMRRHIRCCKVSDMACDCMIVGTQLDTRRYISMIVVESLSKLNLMDIHDPWSRIEITIRSSCIYIIDTWSLWIYTILDQELNHDQVLLYI